MIDDGGGDRRRINVDLRFPDPLGLVTRFREPLDVERFGLTKCLDVSWIEAEHLLVDCASSGKKARAGQVVRDPEILADGLIGAMCADEEVAEGIG